MTFPYLTTCPKCKVAYNDIMDWAEQAKSTSMNVWRLCYPCWGILSVRAGSNYAQDMEPLYAEYVRTFADWVAEVREET